MSLTNRRCALCALVLAVGNACATSEEPDTSISLGGNTSAGTQPIAGAGATGNSGGAEPGAGAGGLGTPGGRDSGGEGGVPPSGGSGPSGGVAGGNEAGAGPSGGRSGGASGGGRAGAAAGGAAAGASPNGGSGGASGGNAGKAGGSGASGRGGSGGGSAGAGVGGGKASGECDWKASACEDVTCAKGCPSNMGTYCVTTCQALVDCVADAVSDGCGTKSDPMCVLRNNGSPNECTPEWESAGSSTTNAGPSKAATLYFECACGVNVP